MNLQEMSIRANSLLESEEEQLDKLGRHTFLANHHTQMLKNIQQIMHSNTDDMLPSLSPRQHKELEDRHDHHADKIEKHWGAIHRIRGNREAWTQQQLDTMNIARQGHEIMVDNLDMHPTHNDELRAFRSYT